MFFTRILADFVNSDDRSGPGLSTVTKLQSPLPIKEHSLVAVHLFFGSITTSLGRSSSTGHSSKASQITSACRKGHHAQRQAYEGVASFPPMVSSRSSTLSSGCSIPNLWVSRHLTLDVPPKCLDSPTGKNSQTNWRSPTGTPFVCAFSS